MSDPTTTPTAPKPEGDARADPAARWRAIRAWFTRTYLTVDPRSLGAGRIALALVLLIDLLRRVPDIELWYSNNGLVPNHTLLWRPPTQWMFSFFFMASWTDEAVIGFVLCGLVYLGLLVGWRTRLMQFLSLLAVLSLHGRSTFIENGGDWMLAELSVWTAFLPLGRRFSVDAWLAGLRPDGKPDNTPVVSLAMLGILIQLAVSYIFNALHKGGATWRDGTAVHYVLHQDRMVTWLGVWARPYMTLLLSKVLSYGSLVVESLLPVLVGSPVYRVVTRRLAILSVIALHLGFQLAINLGVFSLVMIAYVPFLMTSEDWEVLGRWATRRGSIPRPGRWLSSWLLSLAPVARLAARAARRPAPPPPTPAMAFRRRLVAVLREGMVAVMIAVLASELFIGNAILSTRLKFPQPELMKMLVAYPRLIQAWSMFAPDAPTVDETIVIDAVTADGRHVDPYNQIAGRYPSHATTEIPVRLGNDSFFFNYSSRIPFTQTYWGALQEWILAYPRRTGRAEDRIVSFEVSIVEDDSPPPGETQPRKVRSRVFLR
ncbi:MAG TPA: HTTM domain-containing protein, partial [Polyangia bacterium]|nr:HTTM domain-containing protein [Polyangia bacterium]